MKQDYKGDFVMKSNFKLYTSSIQSFSLSARLQSCKIGGTIEDYGCESMTCADCPNVLEVNRRQGRDDVISGHPSKHATFVRVKWVGEKKKFFFWKTVFTLRLS
jgi:hypothetical protein